MRKLMLGVLFVLVGCAMLRHNLPSQSWDQANLKRNDHGCPTAIYIAPSGNLVQCEQSADDMPTTEVEAAVLALKFAYDHHPHYYEYGGVIVRTPNGKYNPSKPTTIGHADSMEIDEDFESYAGGYPVVADYHTHPCIDGYVPGVFSPADLHSSREDGHGGYILDECTGDVHYWKPGDPYDAPEAADDLMSKIFGQPQTAKGKIVGHIPVDGKAFAL